MSTPHTAPFTLDAEAVRSACYHLAWAVVDDWETSHAGSAEGMSETHQRLGEVVVDLDGQEDLPWKLNSYGTHCHPAGYIEAAVHLLWLAVADGPPAGMGPGAVWRLTQLTQKLGVEANRWTPPAPQEEST